MADFVKCAIPNRYIGAHADTKPASCGVGSICYETDTGAEYITADGGSTWVQYAATQYFADISAANLTLSGTTGALTFSAAATIVAASGLTMPAFTLGGAVTGNAQTVSDINLTVGASRTLDVSAGTLTLAADQISGDKIEGGTINAITINTLTLGTSLAGADKPFTGLGDFTFTDGSILATATSDSAALIFKATDDDGVALAQLEVGRLVGANDPYWAFGGSQEWQFFNSGVATVAAAKTLTFGNVGTTIRDTYVQFSNGSGTAGAKLKYSNATRVAVRNAADNAGADFNVASLYFDTKVEAGSSALSIIARDADDGYLLLKARDNGVGVVEIARMVGAADPYFRVGRDDTGVALNAVTDGLYLQMAGGTGNSSAGQGFGMPFYLGNAASETEERASIDCVLTTATNGAEDAEFRFNLQGAGAAPSLALTLSATTATFATDVVMGTQVIDADSGAVTLVDMSVTDAPADNTEESYAFKLDGAAMLTIYGLADSAGAVDNTAVKLGTYLQLHSTDTDSATEGQVWYDASTHTIVYHNGTAVKTLAVTA